MDEQIRLNLQILEICGVRTSHPLYIKFLWRGEKQKSPLVQPSQLQQPQQHPLVEFLLPYNWATDGTRLLLRLWVHQRLRHKQLAEGWLMLPTDKDVRPYFRI